MQQKKTTKEEYQKCVNVVVEYINQHLGAAARLLRYSDIPIADIA